MRHLGLRFFSLAPALTLALTQPACGAARCDDIDMVKERAVEPGARFEPAASPTTPSAAPLELEGTVTHITSTLASAGLAEVKIEVAGAHPGTVTATMGSRPALPIHEGDAIRGHFACDADVHGRRCGGYVTDPKGLLLLATAIDRDDLAPGFRCQVDFVRCATAADRVRTVRFVGPDGADVTSDNHWQDMNSQGAAYVVWGSATEAVDSLAPVIPGSRVCSLVRRIP